jgi:hypothetical protein
MTEGEGACNAEAAMQTNVSMNADWRVMVMGPFTLFGIALQRVEYADALSGPKDK